MNISTGSPPRIQHAPCNSRNNNGLSPRRMRQAPTQSSSVSSVMPVQSPSSSMVSLPVGVDSIPTPPADASDELALQPDSNAEQTMWPPQSLEPQLVSVRRMSAPPVFPGVVDVEPCCMAAQMVPLAAPVPVEPIQTVPLVPLPLTTQPAVAVPVLPTQMQTSTIKAAPVAAPVAAPATTASGLGCNAAPQQLRARPASVFVEVHIAAGRPPERLELSEGQSAARAAADFAAKHQLAPKLAQRLHGLLTNLLLKTSGIAVTPAPNANALGVLGAPVHAPMACSATA